MTEELGTTEIVQAETQASEPGPPSVEAVPARRSRKVRWAGLTLLVLAGVLLATMGWHFLAIFNMRGGGGPTSITPSVTENQAPQLLWDFTSPRPVQPNLSEDLKKRIIDQIWPITHTTEEVLFTSSVRGAFYPGVPADSQLAIAAVQNSVNRDQVQGPWSFLIIETGSDLELIQNPYGTDLLRAFRPAGAHSDLLVADTVGGEQGEERHFARVLSVANHAVQVVATLGISEFSNCESFGAIGHVADRILYSYTPSSGLTVQSRQHLFQACGGDARYRPLSSNSPDAEEALLALQTQSVSTGSESGAPDQDGHAAANAAIETKIDAQPGFTSIPITTSSHLVDQIFGHGSNLNDLTNGQLEWTLVAVSGVVDLRECSQTEDRAPAGERVYVKYGSDGKPNQAVFDIRTTDAWTWKRIKQEVAAGSSLAELPAENNPCRKINVVVEADSARQASALHDGDRIVIVGQFLTAGSGLIMVENAHIPPPGEVRSDRIVVNRPISVRDMKNPWTW